MKVSDSGNTWQEIKNTNPIVNAVLRAGGDATDCAIALADQNQKLLERIMELESIAPFKVKIGGQTLLWRCPDHMVPER